MRSTEARIIEMHSRAERIRKARARRRYRAVRAAASAVCAALAIALALLVSRFDVGAGLSDLTASGMASIFTRGGALGYVLVAVLAFCLGALLTVFCTRLKRRMDEKERSDDRKL